LKEASALVEQLGGLRVPSGALELGGLLAQHGSPKEAAFSGLSGARRKRPSRH